MLLHSWWFSRGVSLLLLHSWWFTRGVSRLLLHSGRALDGSLVVFHSCCYTLGVSLSVFLGVSLSVFLGVSLVVFLGVSLLVFHSRWFLVFIGVSRCFLVFIGVHLLVFLSWRFSAFHSALLHLGGAGEELVRLRDLDAAARLRLQRVDRRAALADERARHVVARAWRACASRRIARHRIIITSSSQR